MYTPRINRRALLYGMTVALMLSEGIYDLVFANMAFSASGRAGSVATTYAVGYSAEILVTIFGAGFLDYFDKRRIFVGAQIVKIVLFASVVLISSMTTLSVPMIWGFAFAIDLIHHYSRLCAFVLIASLFDKTELPAIQGTNAVLGATAQIASPLLAAAAIAVFGLGASLGVSVGLQLVALALAVTMFQLAPYRRAAREGAADGAKHALLGTLRASAEMARDRRWRPFLALYSGSGMLIAISVLLWIPLLRGLHDVPESTTGWFLSFGAVGMVLGGIAVRRVGDAGQRNRRYVSTALVVMSVSLAGAILRPGAWVLVGAATLLFHVGLTLFFRVNAVLIQANLPPDRAGSWYGVVDFLGRIFGMIGVLSAGLLFDQLGPVWLFGAIAVGLAGCSMAWLSRGLTFDVPTARYS